MLLIGNVLAGVTEIGMVSTLNNRKLKGDKTHCPIIC